MGFLTMFLIMLLCARANRNKLTRAFTKLQIVSAAFMATSHGLNDAQKTMGVITLALFIFNKIDTIAVPFWVKCVCALAMAMGTALGGWKIIKTMGHKIFKLEPVHGFATETSAAAVICGASLFGAPVSTTHTITEQVYPDGTGWKLRSSAQIDALVGAAVDEFLSAAAGEIGVTVEITEDETARLISAVEHMGDAYEKAD